MRRFFAMLLISHEGHPQRRFAMGRRAVAVAAALAVSCATLAAGPGEALAVPTAGVPGTLDTTWSGDGIATLQTKYQPVVRGLAGSRLAVGLYKDSDGGAFRLWKLNELGAPLATYGGGLGYVKRSFAPGGVSFPVHVFNYGTDQVVVGSYNSATVARLGVARLLDNGAYKVIGSTPGHNIYKVFTYEHHYLEPFAAGVLSNGRLMVAVAAFRYNSADDLVYQGQAIIKLNNNGSMDRTFSGDGILPVAKDVGDITFGPDGSTFMGRKIGDYHEIRKFTPAGALDPTFSGDGKYLVPCGTWNEGADLEADSSGRVLVICHNSNPVNTGGGPNLRLIRVTPQGILDPTYSGNGMETVRPNDAFETWSYHVEDAAFYLAQTDGLPVPGSSMGIYAVDATGTGAWLTGSSINLPAPPEFLVDMAVTDGRLIVASARGASSLDLIAVSILTI